MTGILCVTINVLATERCGNICGGLALSFVGHAVHGAREHNKEQAFFGQSPISVWEFARTSEFWFQSFQNWQSEFLAVGAIVVLTIYLRQKGSAESKRLGAPHAKTGSD